MNPILTMRQLYHKLYYDDALAKREYKHIELRHQQRLRELAESKRNTRSVDSLRFLTPPAIGSPLLNRLGGNSDGGYFVPLSNFGATKLLSLGVGGVILFEEDMAKRGVYCALVDGTVPPPVMKGSHIFLSKMVGLGPGRVTIDSLLQELNWVHERVLFSVDIEGGEWDAMHKDSLSDRSMLNIPWLTIELHELHTLFLEGPKSVRMWDTLNRLMQVFDPVYLNVNNTALAVQIDGVSLPPVVELTLVRKNLVKEDFRLVKEDFRASSIRNSRFQPPITWPF